MKNFIREYPLFSLFGLNCGLCTMHIGDFASDVSKPLHDFIHESNIGNDIFFVAAKDEAVKRLTTATSF